MGGNHPEKYYQKAVAIALTERGLSFIEQYYVPVTMHGKPVGRYYLDFLIEDCVILELKRGKYVPKMVFHQTKKYLSALDLELALVACFATDCVIIKRILNLKNP
mgnify:CR=1 FL=1